MPEGLTSDPVDKELVPATIPLRLLDKGRNFRFIRLRHLHYSSESSWPRESGDIPRLPVPCQWWTYISQICCCHSGWQQNEEQVLPFWHLSVSCKVLACPWMSDDLRPMFSPTLWFLSHLLADATGNGTLKITQVHHNSRSVDKCVTVCGGGAFTHLALNRKFFQS